MKITYNEYNWPLFDNISAISPSKISQLLSYLLYGSVAQDNLKYAKFKGNNIELAFYKYIETKNISLAVYQGKNKKEKQNIIKLCYWFNKKFPYVELLSYQEIFYNFPYGCISDFKLRFSKNGEIFLIDLKTNNKKYYNKLLQMIWDIQFYLLEKCSGYKVYYIWITEEKIINKKWEYPKDYNLDKLITYLLYLNSLELEHNNYLKNIDMFSWKHRELEDKKELLKKYLERDVKGEFNE